MYPNGLLIKLVDRLTGEDVCFPGGAKAEGEFTELLLQAILPKGVGIFKTQAQVKAAIEQGLHEALRAFKSRTVKG